MTGKLENETITVTDQADASRIYSRGYFGEPGSDGSLRLTLMEAIFLIDAKRFRVYHEDERLQIDALVKYANRRIPGFEVKNIVYRELRQRGYAVKPGADPVDFQVFPRGSVPTKTPARYWVLAMSERDRFTMKDILSVLDAAKSTRKELLLGVVDEEGDLTYYRVRYKSMPKGRVGGTKGAIEKKGGKTKISCIDDEEDAPPLENGAAGADAESLYDALENGDEEPFFPESQADLINDRVVIWDASLGAEIRESGFYGNIIGKYLHTSLLEAAYLIENGQLEVSDAKTGRKLPIERFVSKARKIQADFDVRYVAYKNMKANDLIVKTGFKYGAHFRVYKGDPEIYHADYLVHIIPHSFKSTYPEMSRAIRLAHSVRKRMMFGVVEGDGVKYVEIVRVRP